MKNIYPEYPCFPQDFISSFICNQMSLEEFGFFNWFLMHSWVYSENPCHLPNNEKQIAWLLRKTNDNQLIINCLTSLKNTKKLVETEDKKFLYNPRLLSEYYKLCNKSKTMADNRLGKTKTDDNQKIIKRKSKEQQADTDTDTDIKYSEFVYMSISEYNTLVEKHTEPVTKRLIEILDNYKGSSGKTYKSDYRAILNWVVKRYEEEKTKIKQKNPLEGRY